MTYGRFERMACQGRAAAPAGWRGPQRSEDTGQAGRTLDVTGAAIAWHSGGRDEGRSPPPLPPEPHGGECGAWGSAPSEGSDRSPLGIAGGCMRLRLSFPRHCRERGGAAPHGLSVKGRASPSPSRPVSSLRCGPRHAGIPTLDPQSSPGPRRARWRSRFVK